MKVALLVFGTRPEAIKLAPIIRLLRYHPHVRPVVVVTGQHRQILDQVLSLFRITPDHDLNLMTNRQSLAQLTTGTLDGLEAIFLKEYPDVVIVQGDTTTAFAAALAAFYHRISVVHVEAGLRSGDSESPYPEEINRQLTSRLTALHLCPTSGARLNLLAEAVPAERIFVTGNTVIDSLQWVQAQTRIVNVPGLRRPLDGERLILVTAHRRESWDHGLTAIAQAVRDVAASRQNIRVVCPIHPNPVVRDAMVPLLRDLENVDVIDPVDYQTFVHLLAHSHVVLTDSGGVQEEAPSFGVPVLIARENTERPEAVAAGTARLVTADRPGIVTWLTRLIDDPAEHARMSGVRNPFGDGLAAERSVGALSHLLLGESLPTEFVCGSS